MIGPVYYLDDSAGRVACLVDGSRAQRIRVDGGWRWKVIHWGAVPQHPDRWCIAAHFCRRENGISPPPRAAAFFPYRGAN
ncbi:hypothetical protein [Kaistia sp. MMO-174]|uniref:hypothetical protein n=1 Tax=Kaistia sp. MMO-174 TaxID=3081256 RepID=UPI003019992A